ncbi:MAG: hypothetical protein QOG03_1424 [Actinomycetota bacterium]|nr:hypothetical protein [Actinomycetota bacterium]
MAPDSEVPEGSRAKTVTLGGGRVLAGAASWSDRSLVKESGWYPRSAAKAADRMAFYASRLPLVEMDSTYRFPPTADVCRQWVERTPEGFTIDVRAWSLFSGQPALPTSLWPDLQDEVQPEARDRPRLYASHLSKAAIDECWARFAHALSPLVEAGRIGVVLFQLPHWMKPGDTSRALLTDLRSRLPDHRLAVEVTNPRWVSDEGCEDTLSLFEHLDLTFVCVDAPQLPRVVAATSSVAMVRFYGHPDDEDAWGPPRPTWHYDYRYSRDELEGWLPAVDELAGSADEVHLVMNNCWRDHAVANAEELVSLLQSRWGQ